MSSARRYVAGGLLACLAVVVWLALRGDGTAQELHAQFASAPNLVAGADVTMAGKAIGKVKDVTVERGLAGVTLQVDDGAWPLPQGTRAAIRYGGSVSYASRYVELTPGKRDAPPLPDGAQLRAPATITPVEFDELFNMFDPPTRADLGAFVERGGETFGDRSGALRDGLRAGGPALDASAELLHQLGADPYALRTLVSANAKVADALRRRQPQLHDLVDGMATTFGQIADREAATRATLRRLPGTLSSTRGMLARLTPSLDRLDALTTDIRPGARGLRALAPRARRTLVTLRDVAPQLDATLATAKRSAPQITALLNEARPLLGRLAPVLEHAAPMVSCLRAYTPEIAGFFTSWLGLATTYDANGHYGRVLYQAFPFNNGTPITSAQAQQASPNLDYTLLRPPGYAAGTPWLKPECGVGPDKLDSSKDPEARR